MKIAILFAFAACATAADWSIVSKDLLTTELGIGFRSENEGFVAGDANGAGPEIFHTTDGGVTWNASQANFGRAHV